MRVRREGEIEKERRDRRRGGGSYAIPDKQPVIAGAPEGPNMQAEEIRCQFNGGRAANSQVSLRQTRGHLKNTADVLPPLFPFLFPTPEKKIFTRLATRLPTPPLPHCPPLPLPLLLLALACMAHATQPPPLSGPLYDTAAL